MKSSEITVMIVDDSPVARLVLTRVFAAAGISVVASVANGREAIKQLSRVVPDVVVMDVVMPGMDGLEATRHIMENLPVPIVVASNVLLPSDAAHVFRCLEVGAVALVEKPVGSTHPDYERLARTIVRTVAAMAGVKVIRRWPARLESEAGGTPPLPKSRGKGVRVIGIGASTGGPNTIRAILEKLDPNFPLPILIVQHMAAGFLPGLADWLTSSTGSLVSVAQQGQAVAPGMVLLAPDSYQMRLNRDMTVSLEKGAVDEAICPSISFLFHSVAEAVGSRSVGIVLTGMGADGVLGLRRMREAGAVTIAQDESTSIIYGMPREAIRSGAAEAQMTPHQIARTLTTISQNTYE